MENKQDQWVKCISTQGNIRGVALQATGLIQGMVERHQLQGTHARALGEAVMGALLLASYCKHGQRINLNIRGSAGIQQALVDAYPDGNVRGYLIPRERPILDKDRGPWGDGLLSILRTKDQVGENPYIGTVPLLTGFLAKDLSFYWLQSEQVPSAVGLVVHMKDNQVIAAGGFLVQVMPGATQAEVNQVEQHIQDVQSVTDHLTAGTLPLNILSQIFQSTPFVVVEEKSLQFKCNCSFQRVERALLLVGKEELKQMLDEDHEAKVKCDFCTNEYRLDSAQLTRMIESLSSDGV